MTPILAIYQVPSIKHTFFIVACLKKLSDIFFHYKESTIKDEKLSLALKKKDCFQPKSNKKWKSIILEEKDFLKLVSQSLPEDLISTNKSCRDPENMELLGINLVKNYKDTDIFPFHSKKILSNVSEEDVIEVFI